MSDPGMTLLAAVNAQTLVDAVGLGAVYALMAVGIGLVFGVLRLVNFAYGQLVMAGAYTLAWTSAWPGAASIAACFAVVLALTVAMDRAVFRPLRTQSPAVMLVTTFAVAFADRTYVLANGEVRMILTPADADDTEKMIAAYLS